MTSTDIEVRVITADQTWALRAEVLRPGAPVEETRFAGDDHPDTIHLGAFVNGVQVGIASLMVQPCTVDPQDADWQLRGMATANELQGQGIGTRLLRECLHQVRQRGARRLWCNGRTSARPFYERLGFRTVGEEFVHPTAGPHFVMIRELDEKAVSGRQ